MTRTRTSLLAVAALIGALFVGSIPASAGGAQGSWCGDKSRITVLGGSTSTGYQTVGYVAGGDGTYQPTRNGWWSRVTANAQQAWGTQGTNNARSGALTSDFSAVGRWPVTRDAVPTIAQQQPSLVILQLGVNEYLNQVAPTIFETELRRLVTEVRVARPGVDLLFIVGWRVAKPGAAFPWTDYSSGIGRVARDMGGAMIDLRQLMDGTDSASAHFLYVSDGIHANDAGQLILAGMVWSQLVASTCATP